jgi:cyclopropane-fatty-acyl-phospholipid synthase
MSLFDKFITRVIIDGTLTITFHSGETKVYGTARAGFPDIKIRFADARVPRDIAMTPDLGAAETYIDHRLVIENDDIMGLLTLVRDNIPWERGRGIADASIFSRLWREVTGRIDRINWRARSKANVAHHYNLDDRLYDLFLDSNRQYSCGYFTDPANSLEQAQTDKMAHIAAKLALKPGQTVLDIGSGWGGMALYLHKVARVDVTGVTLSEEQLRYANEAAMAAGVADHVRFKLLDYRDVEGRFDRIVSVGMFEHVGPPNYERFFQTCRDLLRDDGVMLLHTIGRMNEPGTSDRFITKYIFPGGYSPSLSEIVRASERTGLILSDMETLRLHYAYTLRHWYARTMAARAEITALYDDRFFRMWQFYLAGAATSFEQGIMCNYQLQYVRERRTLPLTRDYMGKAEEQLCLTGLPESNTSEKIDNIQVKKSAIKGTSEKYSYPSALRL